jgi:penicillin-binding protein 1B
MNRAIKLPQYSDMKSFAAPPDGIQVVPIDYKNTWLPADSTCPEDYSFAFLDGTVPNSTCSHMGASPQSLLQRLFSGGTANPNAAPTPPANPQSPDTAEPTAPKKKNLLEKIFGGGNKPAQPTPPPPPPPPPQ